jgi:peptidoglycan/LPS O-acetylase OafA/YrhL
VYREYIPSEFHFLAQFTEYGHFGVDLFFIISGFVIAFSSEGRTFSKFVSARFIRLFPVFWICVSITTLFIILTKGENVSLYRYLANLTMLPYYYGDYPYIDTPYWTLEIELKFYAVASLILLLKNFIIVRQQQLAIFFHYPFCGTHYIMIHSQYLHSM